MAAFLDGGPAAPAQLKAWANSYQGRGRGRVVWDAFPEPFLGRLDQRTAGVVLALNPGIAHLDFQGRSGVFADEIRAMGSYTAWAASWPYLRDPWVAVNGRNRHHASRLAFVRNWHQDQDLDADSMVAFELYPWHSTNVTAAIRPSRDVLRSWVWEPIAELGAPVFAFGAPWFRVLEDSLGLIPLVRLGAGGQDYGSAVPSRSVVVYGDDISGVTVIAERHLGSAGPPQPCRNRPVARRARRLDLIAESARGAVPHVCGDRRRDADLCGLGDLLVRDSVRSFGAAAVAIARGAAYAIGYDCDEWPPPPHGWTRASADPSACAVLPLAITSFCCVLGSIVVELPDLPALGVLVFALVVAAVACRAVAVHEDSRRFQVVARVNLAVSIRVSIVARPVTLGVRSARRAEPDRGSNNGTMCRLRGSDSECITG